MNQNTTIDNSNTLTHKIHLQDQYEKSSHFKHEYIYFYLKDALNPICYQKIETIYKYVEEHYREKITIQNVALHLNMGTSTFVRFVKHYTGNSFVTLLNNYRISKACSLLKESEYTVAEIAYLTGFNNLANFNRQFKQRIKYTPYYWRKRVV